MPTESWREVERHDLDKIALMALRVQPQRRCRSVEQLAEDLRRSQAGLALAVRRSGLGYRARAFLGRNKIPAAVALAVAVTGLVVGPAVLGARRRRRAGSEARREICETR